MYFFLFYLIKCFIENALRVHGSYISKDFKLYFYCRYFLDILSLVTSFISFLTQNMGWKEGFLFGLEVWGLFLVLCY